jgi:hypothetical protein
MPGRKPVGWTSACPFSIRVRTSLANSVTGAAESQSGSNLLFLGSIHPPLLLPRCATALNFVIPPAPACRGTAADPDFLHRGTAQSDVCGFLKAARSSPTPVRSSFFESFHPPPLMPRCATAINFVIPTAADPGFLFRGTVHGDVCGFRKESRTKFANATKLDRKSGGA